MARFPTLGILDRDEMERIHEASLEILRRVGVRVPHERMRALFALAGADVDGQRVRIPQALVEGCLASAGRRFEIRGRDPSRRARFGFGERNYNSIAGEAHWMDHRTGRRRPAVLEDVRTAARVADALPHLTIAGAMADPADVPVPVRCVEVAAEAIRHTGKPVTFWFHDRRSARWVVELFSAVAGGRAAAAAAPPGYPFLEPISPLSFSADGIDLLFETCAVPLPVPIGPMAQMGATAPGTIAGTLAQENAEILAGICVTQLIREGTPVCYGGIPHAHDMRTSQLIFSGPEQPLMAVAMTQMGKRYGLPVYINVGLTDSKAVDAQAGLEIGASLLPGVLAGADIYGHMGISGVDQASSLPMLVLQDEIIGYVERIASGFAVDEETLAVGVVAETGPGGNYLAHDHTVRHFRRELWFPGILDRQFFDPWDREGRKETGDRVLDRLEGILAGHRPAPLDPGLDHEIGKIVAAARADLLGA